MSSASIPFSSGYLHDDQNLAREPAALICRSHRPISCAFFQRCRQICSYRAQCWRDTEKDSSQQGERNRKAELSCRKLRLQFVYG